MSFLNLPTLAEVNAERRARPKGSEPSRLQVKAAKVKDESKEEKKFIAAVWKRDGGKCRWCGRKCEKRLDLVPSRGEVHHVAGRVVKAIRFDRRNGILLDAACHERLIGKVAEKFLIHSKHTFSVDGIAYINADKPCRFPVCNRENPSGTSLGWCEVVRNGDGQPVTCLDDSSRSHFLVSC